MEDNENNIIVFEWLHLLVHFGIQPRNILSVIEIWCKEILGISNLLNYTRQIYKYLKTLLMICIIWLPTFLSWKCFLFSVYCNHFITYERLKIESWYDTNAIDGDWNIRKHIFETRAGVFILCCTWYNAQKSMKENIRWHRYLVELFGSLNRFLMSK